MRCKDVQAQFSEIYDGVAERQAVLAKHLINCPICAAEYESYSQLLDDVKWLPEPELPVGFHETIMEKIRDIAPPSDHAIDELIEGFNARRNTKRKQPRKKGGTSFVRWGGLAAACLLLVTLWAANGFELPGRRTYDMVMPQAAMEPEMAPIPEEFADEYTAHDFADETNGYDMGVQPWGFEHEDADYEDDMSEIDENARIRGGDITYSPAEEIAQHQAAGVVAENEDLAEDAPITHHPAGEGISATYALLSDDDYEAYTEEELLTEEPRDTAPPQYENTLAFIIMVVAGSLAGLCVVVAAVLFIANKKSPQEEDD